MFGRAELKVLENKRISLSPLMEIFSKNSYDIVHLNQVLRIA